MVTEVLQALAPLPSYSNGEIKKIQNSIQQELQNQKNWALNSQNFESYLEPHEVQENVPITKSRTKKWTETKLEPVYKCQRFFFIKVGGKRLHHFETIEVPRSMEETYVG